LKKIFITLLSVFLVLMSTSIVNAKAGEDAVRLKTTTNYYGIEGTFTIPTDVFVSNDGSYIAFYVGLGDICEGGISYLPSVGWKKALKCGNSPNNYSVPLDVQPTPGSQVNIKLVNNIGSATLYINGYAVTTISMSALSGPTPVKMVHSTQDNQDKNRYKNAKFTNVNVKTGTGSAAYVPFPSNVPLSYPFGASADYVILNSNPLATSLNAGS
jgi:hypothetical protein